MQHHRPTPSRRTPPPDVVRNPNTSPTAPPPARSSQSHPPAQPRPEFLIIGLFALRLAKRLIEGLENYSSRDADVAWLTNFLAPYPTEFALAKISGPRKDDYIAVYQDIVSRMKKQPRYPMRFMQMNPDRTMQMRQQGRNDTENVRPGNMTDTERLAVIDFCDAAAEWGSTVPIPEREAERMIELADQRRIADLEERRAEREERPHYEVLRIEPVLEDIVILNRSAADEVVA